MARGKKRPGPVPKSEGRQLADQFTSRLDVGTHTVRDALDGAIQAIQDLHERPIWIGPQPGEDEELSEGPAAAD